MTGNSLFGLFIILLLLFGVFFAGCSDESPSADTAIPTPTNPVAKYREGDIIGTDATSSSTSLYFILKYDAATDQYTRALIEKNSDDTWGFRPTDRTDLIRREVVERMYPVKVGHIPVSVVPVGIPATLSEPTQVRSGIPPAISKISPGSAAKDTSVSITITGTNFQDGATVKLVQPGSAPLTATGVSASATSITCFFNLNGRSVGSYNLIVVNPDGQSDSKQNMFSIGEASPIITGVNPVTAKLNDRVPVSIYGQNFRNNLKVSFTKGTKELICTNPISQESIKISCNLNLDNAQAASFGDWTVTVLNVDDQTKGTWPKKFVVTNATPKED